MKKLPETDRNQKMPWDLSAPPSAPPMPQVAPSSVEGEMQAKALIRRAQTIHKPDMLEEETNRMVNQILWESEALEPHQRNVIHDVLRERIGWNKALLRDQRKHVRNQKWLEGAEPMIPDGLRKVLAEFVYVITTKKFFRPGTGCELTMAAFRCRYCHLVDANESVTNIILRQNLIPKVDRVDCVPGFPRVFEKDGIEYVNTWDGVDSPGGPQ